MRQLCHYARLFQGFLLIFLASLVAPIQLQAQENNPLINSGELIDKGVVLLDAGQSKQAFSLFTRIDRNDSNYAKALYNIALCHDADSDYAGAQHFCELAFAAQQYSYIDNDAEIWNEYGNSFEEQGKPLQALAAFDSAIRKYPRYGSLYLNKGTVLMGLDRIKEAEAFFQQALLIDPFCYGCHFKLASAALLQGKLIPATLSLIGYLVLEPEGKYHGTCIAWLDSIFFNDQAIKRYIAGRTQIPEANYQMMEQILRSRIALDSKYKPLLHLDDPLSRQIQVLFEKIAYDENSRDFYMQYYVPFYQSVFHNDQFEVFINHIFAGVNLPAIRDFSKKNQNEMAAFTRTASDYFSKIRATRELMPQKRVLGNSWYFLTDGRPMGKGTMLNNGNKPTGPWEFYHEYGNLAGKGFFDANGDKQGSWVYYYDDGKLSRDELYKDGRHEGEENGYFDNGKISYTVSYKNNLPDGRAIYYFTTGATHIICYYKAGKLDGEKITYYNNGNPSTIEHYKDGKKDGETRSLNQDGTLDFTMWYTNDQPEGSFKRYYKNGQIEQECQFINGLGQGSYKYYYESGKLKQELPYINDQTEGLTRAYYENAVVAVTATYKNGKLYGLQQRFDEDGKLYAELTYDNGKPISARYFDKSGRMISESEPREGRLNILGYNAEGVKEFQQTYNVEGLTEGKTTKFYASGAISETTMFHDAILDGPSTSWYPDGTIKEEEQYINAQKAGYYKGYHKNGLTKSEGWYVDDQTQGNWLYYDETGKLTDSIYFLNNEKEGFWGQFLPNGKKEFDTEIRQGTLTGTTQYDTNGVAIRHISLPGGSGRYALIYPDGTTFLDATYNKGNLEGSRKTYYFDGKLRTEEYFKDGLQDSVDKEYSHDGNLTCESWFHAGDRTDTLKRYFKDGKISSTQTYKFGRLQGKYIVYFQNGQVSDESTYKEDDLDGPVRKYDVSGVLLYQLNYEAGKLVSYTYEDKNGRLIPPISIVGDSAKIKTRFANGTVSARMEFKDGLEEGPRTLYYPDGKTRAVYPYHLNQGNGFMRIWFPNGKIHNEYTYFYGNLHGLSKEYNEAGILIKEVNYYNGRENGATRRYDNTGALIETDYYYYGKLLSVN